MSSDIFEQILREHKELSSLPHTLAEVLRVIRDDNATARDMADVLMKDPALTAKILRIVNSPFYGAGREITTVSQAVMTLGTRAVSALALSTSIYDLTGKWQSTIDRVRFWRHSLSVALAARAIAEEIGYAYPEEAFICGLLHDIGVLVLEKSFPDKFARIWKQVEAGDRIHELEEDIWGTNHARVGQFLLEQWRLPSVISQAIGQHHSEHLTLSSDPELMPSQIVALANGISCLTIATVRPELSVDQNTKEALREALKLDPEKLRRVEESLMTKLCEEARFLEINIGSQEEILAEANRIVYEHYLTVEKLLRDNHRMQQEIARAQIEKAALDALRTITATFNHYVNNASATILGRAQLIELKVKDGIISDPEGEIVSAMTVIVDGVNTIRLVMEELTRLTTFKTIVYHNDTYIIDIENRLRKRLDGLKQHQAVSE